MALPDQLETVVRAVPTLQWHGVLLYKTVPSSFGIAGAGLEALSGPIIHEPKTSSLQLFLGLLKETRK